MLIILESGKYVCENFIDLTTNITQAGHFDYIAENSTSDKFFILNSNGEFLCQNGSSYSVVLNFERQRSGIMASKIKKIAFVHKDDKYLSFNVNGPIYSFFEEKNVFNFSTKVKTKVEFQETSKSVEHTLCSLGETQLKKEFESKEGILKQKYKNEIDTLKLSLGEREESKDTPYGKQIITYVGNKLVKTVETVGEYIFEQIYNFAGKSQTKSVSKGKMKFDNFYDDRYESIAFRNTTGNETYEHEAKLYSTVRPLDPIYIIEEEQFLAYDELRELNQMFKMDNPSRSLIVEALIKLYTKYPTLTAYNFDKTKFNLSGHTLEFYIGHWKDLHSLKLIKFLRTLPGYKVNSRRLIDSVSSNIFNCDVEIAIEILKYSLSNKDYQNYGGLCIPDLLTRGFKDKTSNAYQFLRFLVNDPKFLPSIEPIHLKTLIDSGIFEDIPTRKEWEFSEDLISRLDDNLLYIEKLFSDPRLSQRIFVLTKTENLRVSRNGIGSTMVDVPKDTFVGLIPNSQNPYHPNFCRAKILMWDTTYSKISYNNALIESIDINSLQEK